MNNKLLISFIIFAIAGVAITAWLLLKNDSKLGVYAPDITIEESENPETTTESSAVDDFFAQIYTPDDDPQDDPEAYFQGQMAPQQQPQQGYGYGGYNDMQPPPPPDGFGGGFGGPGGGMPPQNGSGIQIGVRYGTKDAGVTITGITQQKLYATVDKNTNNNAYIAIIPKVDDTELIDLNDIEEYAYIDKVIYDNDETAVSFDLSNLMGSSGEYRLVMFPRNKDSSGKNPFVGFGWGSEYLCIDFNIGVQIR